MPPPWEANRHGRWDDPEQSDYSIKLSDPEMILLIRDAEPYEERYFEVPAGAVEHTPLRYCPDCGFSTRDVNEFVDHRKIVHGLKLE